jgi:CelD/BcsL family acetyltransferase involved in cellulose biosynthesis
MERQRRRLERDDTALRFEFDNRGPSPVKRLIEWKGQQLRQSGRTDIFALREVCELMKRVACADSPPMAGRSSCLWSGERLLAVNIGVQSETVLAGWRTAYDPAAAARSPGIVNLLHLIEGAAQAGLQKFDLGTGNEAFKLALATDKLVLLEGYVGRPSVGRRVSTRVKRLMKTQGGFAEATFSMRTPPRRLALTPAGS